MYLISDRHIWNKPSEASMPIIITKININDKHNDIDSKLKYFENSFKVPNSLKSLHQII